MGGCGVKRRKPYPYVHEIVDRHGYHRAYLRKPGCPSAPLPLPIGSRAFIETYQTALEQEVEKKVMIMTRKNQDSMMQETGLSTSLSEEEVKKYMDEVIQEVKRSTKRGNEQ